MTYLWCWCWTDDDDDVDGSGDDGDDDDCDAAEGDDGNDDSSENYTLNLLKFHIILNNIKVSSFSPFVVAAVEGVWCVGVLISVC